MSYSVKTIPTFDKQLKRLAKKYRSIKDDILEFAESILANPKQGIPLGKNCYKIRLAIKSKGQGKSGGARVVVHIVYSDEDIYFLSIYDKAELENISEQELKRLLDEI